MLREFRGRRPEVSESAFVDPSAQVIGDVRLGDQVSIWANATLRGDIAAIRVGAGSNIQDNSCLHVDNDEPVDIGESVVVGHSCVIHGCSIGDGCLIGMGSTVLSGAKVGAGSLVAAGSLLLEGREYPPNSMIMGSPAKVRRETTEAEREKIRRNAERYVALSREYLKES